jgi:aminoglycoside/choline kinase family phosphotransferase
VDPDFVRHFHLQTLQRKLKDAGRFVFIHRRRGNPGFLKFFPASVGYVRQALEALGQWPEVLALLDHHLEPALAALAQGQTGVQRD